MANSQEKNQVYPPLDLWQAWKRIFAFTRPYLFPLVLGLLFTALSTAIWLTIPLGLRSLLDSVFEQGDRDMLDFLALALLGLFLLQSLFHMGSHYWTSWVGERVVTDLRKRVYEHFHRLGLRFYADRRLGELMSRLTNDIGAIREAATEAIGQVLMTCISTIGSVVAMVVLNWRLSLVVFAAAPIAAVGTRYFGQRIRDLSRLVQDRLADTTAVAEEALSAIRVVKAFAREVFEVDRYNKAVEDLFQLARYRAIVTALFSASIAFLFMVALVAIFWYGGTEVLAGRLSAGDLVAFIFYAMNISRSVMGISRLYTSLNSAVGASEHIFELLETDPEIANVDGALPLEAVRGAVLFDQVSFAYSENVPILQDVSFEIEPGQTIALVGPSGAGKTTLLNLISRFYDPTSGHILVDNKDVSQVQVRSLREQIALVSQDVHLFGTSIFENIQYGRLDAAANEIHQAARDANAHEFIVGFPDGYDSLVGERGVKLSGGQRQRIAIARAILRDARILLLDEATSSLDSASEALVQQALERLMQGRTTFIIAHRLSTVQHADQILVLDDGRIVQTGRHQELLKIGGLYKKLCDLQFRNMVEAP
jgi:subfamily B ATP-binding cassette protein MsbA